MVIQGAQQSPCPIIVQIGQGADQGQQQTQAANRGRPQVAGIRSQLRDVGQGMLGQIAQQALMVGQRRLLPLAQPGDQRCQPAQRAGRIRPELGQGSGQDIIRRFEIGITAHHASLAP